MEFTFRKYFTPVLLLFFFGSTTVVLNQERYKVPRKNDQAISNQIKHVLRSLQHRYAPDLRLAVFDISPLQVEQGTIVRGEVDNPDARRAVIRAMQKIVKDSVIDSIRVLPEPALGSHTMGIVLHRVADIRRKPGTREELLTQALMGTVVKLLKKEGSYFFVQTPDRYLGWLDTASVFVSDRAGVNAWNAAPKVIMTKFAGQLYAQPDTSSAAMCEIIDGCILTKGSEKNGWRAVGLADGRIGFVQDSLVQDFDEWNKSRIPTGEHLEQTARSFLGIRYLWGGLSIQGMDCSGFVKTVYHMNGVELNRDAGQQARQGTRIDPGEHFQNLKKGDLLFFGRKATAQQGEHITHVALYLDNGLYIHSSNHVRLSSLYPSSEYFEEPLLKRFLCARRILQN